MIGYLTGSALDPATILTGSGVGYTVITPQPLPAGDDVSMWIHSVTTDNGTTLYAFTSTDERALFGALLKCPGVGGRTACDIIATAPLPTVIAELAAKNVPWVTTVKGIGKAKAEKLLATLTLPPALVDLGDITQATPADDVVAALADLTGRPPADLDPFVTNLRDTHPDADDAELIRLGLRGVHTIGAS